MHGVKNARSARPSCLRPFLFHENMDGVPLLSCVSILSSQGIFFFSRQLREPAEWTGCGKVWPTRISNASASAGTLPSPPCPPSPPFTPSAPFPSPHFPRTKPSLSIPPPAPLTPAKALEPLASALVDRLMAGEASHKMVNLCLIPIVGGVLLVSREASLTWGGLLFAVASSASVGGWTGSRKGVGGGGGGGVLISCVAVVLKPLS